MDRKVTPPIPEPIAQLQRQLEQFRSTQPPRTKLPDSVWPGCSRPGPATRRVSRRAPAEAGLHADSGFEFFQGTTKLLVPDNPRTGVTRACRYEPDLNRTYHEMAQHYGIGVLPARPRKPRDKAYVSYCTLSRFCNG